MPAAVSILLFLSVRLALGAGCTVVPPGPLRATHLAAAWPDLAGLPVEASFGFAPPPGVRRVLPGSGLARMARQHGMDIARPEPVCIETEAQRLDPVSAGAALDAALRAAFGAAEPEWEIEITDYSRFPLPKGPIEFRPGPREALRPDRADGTRLFRGAVVGGDRLRHPLWVRARIAAERRQIVAAVPLKAGETIVPGALRLEVTRGFPLSGAGAPDPAAWEGKIPRRSFRKGELVPAAALVAPPEIQRGDTVNVDVASGPAHLRLEAEAQTGGRRGERIVLVNSQTKKRFPALVTGPGKATVDAGGVRPGRKS